MPWVRCKNNGSGAPARVTCLLTEAWPNIVTGHGAPQHRIYGGAIAFRRPCCALCVLILAEDIAIPFALRPRLVQRACFSPDEARDHNLGALPDWAAGVRGQHVCVACRQSIGPDKERAALRFDAQPPA